jgi:hypothetical protein
VPDPDPGKSEGGDSREVRRVGGGGVGGVPDPEYVLFCFILRGLDGGSGWGMVADQEPDWIRIRSLLTIFLTNSSIIL